MCWSGIEDSCVPLHSVLTSAHFYRVLLGLTRPYPPPPYTPPTPLAIHKSDNEGHRYHSSPTQRMALANFVEILCIWTALSISLPTGVWLSRRGAFAAIAPAVHGAVHGSATTTRKKHTSAATRPFPLLFSLSLSRSGATCGHLSHWSWFIRRENPATALFCLCEPRPESWFLLKTIRLLVRKRGFVSSFHWIFCVMKYPCRWGILCHYECVEDLLYCIASF